MQVMTASEVMPCMYDAASNRYGPAWSCSRSRDGHLGGGAVVGLREDVATRDHLVATARLTTSLPEHLVDIPVDTVPFVLVD
jgi:hypothetical protein